MRVIQAARDIWMNICDESTINSLCDDTIIQNVAKLLGRTKKYEKIVAYPIHQSKICFCLYSHEILLGCVEFLSNILLASSDEVEAVIKGGVGASLISLFNSPHSEIALKAVSALNNLMDENSELRNLALAVGVVDPILELVKPSSPVIIRVIILLCMFSSSFVFDFIQEDLLLEIAQLIALLSSSEDSPIENPIVMQLLSGLSKLINESNDQIIGSD